MSGMKNSGSVDEILQERASVYGSYKTGVRVRASIVEAMMYKYKETHAGQDEIEVSEMRVMFNDLAIKLMRFAAEPKYEDSLQDLQGYSKLINDTLQGRDSVDN